MAAQGLSNLGTGCLRTIVESCPHSFAGNVGPNYVVIAIVDKQFLPPKR
jgi:hypothetical protein